MTGQLSDEEIKAIAERRAASLKRVQEMNRKANADIVAKGAKPPKSAPARGRAFRHQGR
jgi:hypothetical protein